MKHLKRLLSLALVLVLTVTGLSWPTGTASAAGESAGTFGAEDVSAAPEGLLHAGEWEYWVEDGAAYIAGYTNKAESSLKIPGQLGGYPVVGIGHKAFRDNALSSVQIHTNVTRIANDAFAGGQITIRAYNGSYALLYAAAHGLKKKNLSTAAVFVEHVLDLTGLASAKAYSGLTDTGVTFRAGEATFLREGQILFFPASAAYPGGLAKTVSGLTNNGSTISVTFSQPQWGDVVERVHGSDELILDWDHMTVYEGF